MIDTHTIWIAVEPVDMRLGLDGLTRCLRHALGRSPVDGEAYVFCNRQRTRLKLIAWDGTGAWCSQRRLHRGHFHWPDGDAQTPNAAVQVTPEVWRWLVTGVDWRRLTATLRTDFEL